MAEQIKIDIWGQIEGESDNYRCQPPEVVETDVPAEGDGTIFKRFYNETPCAYHRVTPITSGGRMIIKKDFAYDDWEKRNDSATEFAPIDAQPRTVYRQEIFYSGGTQTVSAVVGSAYTQVLSGGTMRYGTSSALFFESSYFYNGDDSSYQANISSDGTISGKFIASGTYTLTAFLTAPLAKPVPVPIVITVTNS